MPSSKRDFVTHLNPLIRLFLAVATLSMGCQKPSTVSDEQVIGHPGSGGAHTQRANLWYRIGLRDDHLAIAVRLFGPPAATKFFLPDEWAGRDDYVEVIGITGASTSAGPADVVFDRASGTVEVRSDDVAWVELEYRVGLTPRSKFHAQLDHGVLLAFGPTFLVTPAKQILERTTQIPIELNVPADFDVVSTWPKHGAAVSQHDATRRVHQFMAADVAELRDTFVAVGPTLRTVRTGSDQTLVEVAFSPAFEGDTAEFAELVSSVTERFRARFGNAGPVHVFVRTGRLEPGEFGGVGRRGGFILDVPPDTAVSDDTRVLVAHEALHVWNGHLVIPESQVEASTRWFKEGVTHYIALKSLPQLSEQFVLAELAEVAANYAHNPVARGGDGRAVDRARLPYDLGVLVALAFDAALIRNSDGERDISCWLGELVKRSDQRYDEQMLLESLQECAGPRGSRAVAQLWRQWVRVREPIDLRTLFADVGLHWLPQTSQRPSKLVPLDGAAPLYRRLFTLESK